MKKFIVLVAAAAVVGLFPSRSVEASGKKKAITGTVVDTYCLVTMDMGGKSHKSCATTCVKNGAPLAIKEDKTGTVYLTAGHEKNMTYASSGLEKYVEQRVTVRGTVYERDGLKMIVVDSAAPAK
jgi:predicted lipoprotein with Yx(FWY)xxD motif